MSSGVPCFHMLFGTPDNVQTRALLAPARYQLTARLADFLCYIHPEYIGL